MILLTFTAHSNIRLHLDLSVVRSDDVPDLIGPLSIRMNHVILPEVLAHELRVHVETAPIVRIVSKDIADVLVILSSTAFKLSHLHVCGPLLCLNLFNDGWFFIILFRLFILSRVIAHLFGSAWLTLRFHFGVAFSFHYFPHILQVWKLVISR